MTALWPILPFAAALAFWLLLVRCAKPEPVDAFTRAFRDLEAEIGRALAPSLLRAVEAMVEVSRTLERAERAARRVRKASP